MKTKQMIFFFLLFFNIIFIAMSEPINASFTPTWLKVGAFAEYSFDSTLIMFSNFTVMSFSNKIPMKLRWECFELNETLAGLEVSLNAKQDNEQIFISTEIYVNIFNRSVYLQNGTLIGTSLFWIQSNPPLGQEITLWDVPPDKITATFSAITQEHQYVYSPTPQGRQKAIYLSADGYINEEFRHISLVCDADTGLATDGSVDKDPSLTALNINTCGRSGGIDLTDTNIDLGPSEDLFDIQEFLPLIALVVASVIIFVMIYRKLRKH